MQLLTVIESAALAFAKVYRSDKFQQHFYHVREVMRQEPERRAALIRGNGRFLREATGLIQAELGKQFDVIYRLVDDIWEWVLVSSYFAQSEALVIRSVFEIGAQTGKHNTVEHCRFDMTPRQIVTIERAKLWDAVVKDPEFLQVMLPVFRHVHRGIRGVLPEDWYRYPADDDNNDDFPVISSPEILAFLHRYAPGSSIIGCSYTIPKDGFIQFFGKKAHIFRVFWFTPGDDEHDIHAMTDFAVSEKQLKTE